MKSTFISELRIREVAFYNLYNNHHFSQSSIEKTNKIDRINQLLRTPHYSIRLRVEAWEIKWGELAEGRALTQAKEHYYVSLEQEARSVEAT